MKNWFILLCLLVISCRTTKESVLQNVNRKGQPFDIVQDTLMVSRYSRNGKLALEEFKVNDKQVFLRQYFYHKDGSWEMQQGKTFFKNDGFSYSYHPNGKLKIVSQFQKGKENGQRLTYYSDGNRHCVCNFSEGKRSGQQTIYWDNGQLFSKEEYRNGLLLNIEERFHKDGRVMEFGTFKNGNGLLKRYDSAGVLEVIESYQNGVKIKSEKKIIVVLTN